MTRYNRGEELKKPIKDRLGDYGRLLENPFVLEQIFKHIDEGCYTGEIICDNPFEVPLSDEEVETYAIGGVYPTFWWRFTDNGDITTTNNKP